MIVVDNRNMNKKLEKLMLKFKRDTEMFSDTEFRKKWGDKLSYQKMEEKWFEENREQMERFK